VKALRFTYKLTPIIHDLDEENALVSWLVNRGKTQNIEQYQVLKKALKSSYMLNVNKKIDRSIKVIF